MDATYHDADELSQKRERIARLLVEQDLDALLLATSANIAWASGGGRAYIFEATDTGVAALLYRRSGDAFLLTSTIEQARLLAEEMPRFAASVDIQPWFAEDRVGAVHRLVGTARLGADVAGFASASPVPAAVAGLRASLLPAEVERYRWLGQRCAGALEEVAATIQPGISEHQLAGAVSGRLRGQGIVPVVLLVAVDERIAQYRHPLPTDRQLQRYAMVVVCGRRWGLIAAATRLAHLGPLPDDLRRRHLACATVDAAMIGATRPGVRAADLFSACVAAYARVGYPDEWQYHHQGGATGYEGRDWLATPSTAAVVMPRQAFAWNPSIAGTKSEDTLILDDNGQPEVITTTGAWPTVSVAVGNTTLQRPAILEIGA